MDCVIMSSGMIVCFELENLLNCNDLQSQYAGQPYFNSLIDILQLATRTGIVSLTLRPIKAAKCFIFFSPELILI